MYEAFTALSLSFSLSFSHSLSLSLFISLSADLSDIVEKVEWAIENDEEAHRIAQNGFEFVRERLRPQVLGFTRFTSTKVQILGGVRAGAPTAAGTRIYYSLVR